MPEDAQALKTRRRLYDAIVATPGLSARELQQITQTAWGETTYHLLRLEEAGHVLREKGSRTEFYFARELPTASPAFLKLARSGPVRSILAALVEEPELSLDALADATDLGVPALSVHLRRLLETGVVERVNAGRAPTFRLRDRASAGQILVRHRVNSLDALVDRFAVAWAELFPA